MADRRQMALLGFVGHYPALWLAGFRLDRRTARLNLAALAATGVAMAVAALVRPWPWVLLAWLAGHLSWSSFLARAILRGAPGTTMSERRARARS